MKPGQAGVHPFARPSPRLCTQRSRVRSCDTLSTRARSGWLRGESDTNEETPPSDNTHTPHVAVWDASARSTVSPRLPKAQAGFRLRILALLFVFCRLFTNANPISYNSRDGVRDSRRFFFSVRTMLIIFFQRFFLRCVFLVGQDLDGFNTQPYYWTPPPPAGWHFVRTHRPLRAGITALKKCRSVDFSRFLATILPSSL